MPLLRACFHSMLLRQLASGGGTTGSFNQQLAPFFLLWSQAAPNPKIPAAPKTRGEAQVLTGSLTN